MDFLRGKVPDGEEADRLVERALFLMATGYTYTEERREEGEGGEDDGVSAVQSEAAPGDDLVAGAGGSGA